MSLVSFSCTAPNQGQFVPLPSVILEQFKQAATGTLHTVVGEGKHYEINIYLDKLQLNHCNISDTETLELLFIIKKSMSFLT